MYKVFIYIITSKLWPGTMGTGLLYTNCAATAKKKVSLKLTPIIKRLVRLFRENCPQLCFLISTRSKMAKGRKGSREESLKWSKSVGLFLLTNSAKLNLEIILQIIKFRRLSKLPTHIQRCCWCIVHSLRFDIQEFSWEVGNLSGKGNSYWLVFQ